MQTNKVQVNQNPFFKQQIENNEINENKKKLQQEQKAPPDTKVNQAAFNSANANKVLNQSEAKAEANKLTNLTETKNTLKSAFNDILEAFRGNKGPELDTSTKRQLQSVEDTEKLNRKVEAPKLIDPNKNNTGADLMPKVVDREGNNKNVIMANLDALKSAYSLQKQNNELQTQVQVV
jgi:hypothetical protein